MPFPEVSPVCLSGLHRKCSCPPCVGYEGGVVLVSSFRCCVLLAVALLFALLPAPSAPAGQDDPFPVPESIRANVAFWQDIFARYPSSQGVLHDNRNPAIVYEVLHIEGIWDNASRSRDKAKIDAAREKYQGILARLAEGEPAANDDEQRVAALFGPGAAAKEFRAASERIRFQSGQKDRFQEGLIRSGAYLAEIKEIFAGYGLPEDLAYLPHVESSFNYQAYSKVGAAGIWQFMESTGKEFMRVDYAVDERRDPIKATHAAARLLRRNHERLGDWPLAITAYNHGANGMARAKAALGDYERVFNEYESPIFKFASRNFYPEFLAAREVAKNYREYFGPLRFLAPVASRSVPLPDYMHVDELVRYLQVEMTTFRTLNPALREPVYSGQKLIPKGYEVRLPLQDRVLQLASALPDSLRRQEQRGSAFHQVRRGDTVSSIAKRHGVRVQDLVAVNRLDKRAVIQVGQNLRIPATGEKLGQGGGGSGNKSSAPPRPETAPVLAAADVDASLRPEMGQGVAGGRVLEPQTLKIPVPKAPVVIPVPVPTMVPLKTPALQQPSPPTLPVLATPPAMEPVPGVATGVNPAVVVGYLEVERVERRQGGKLEGHIRVEADETIGHYARWLNVSAAELRRLNNLGPQQGLRLHQRIRVPLDKVDKGLFEERRYEFHKEMEEDFFAAYRVLDEFRTYRVKAGDNIWALCQNEFELPFWLIRKYNAGVDFNQLKQDQKILVPRVEAISS